MKKETEKKLEIYNRADHDELFLYGIIGDCAEIKAADVKDAIEKSVSDTLNVHINSKGGEVFESVAILNMLKNSGKKINVYVDGLAASGGSIIAMAGEKVYMSSNAMMMVHNAWSFAHGNSNKLRKKADDMDKVNNSVKASYMSRFKGTEEELTKLLEDETWMNATECEALGLCDGVLKEEGDKGNKGNRQTSYKAEILAKYAPGLMPMEMSENESIKNRAEVIGSFLMAFYENNGENEGGKDE